MNLLKLISGIDYSFKDYLCGSVVAEQFGKTAEDYLELEHTKQYMQCSSEYFGIPLEELVVKTEDQIWLHPNLAVNFLKWVSPEFKDWCREFINTKRVFEEAQQELLNSIHAVRNTQNEQAN